METYTLFKSAQGDIMGATGDIVGATGDILGASGDISGACILNQPYDPNRMQMLRDRVSAAQNILKQAEAEEAQALRDWQICKAKLFCNASSKDARLEEKQIATKSARKAYEAALADLAQAEKVNTAERAIYDKCHAEEIILQREQAAAEAKQAKLDAELAKQQAVLDAQTSEETHDFEIEAKKMATANLEVKKDYAVYGLIGLGAISVIVFGGLMLKK